MGNMKPVEINGIRYIPEEEANAEILRLTDQVGKLTAELNNLRNTTGPIAKLLETEEAVMSLKELYLSLQSAGVQGLTERNFRGFLRNWGYFDHSGLPMKKWMQPKSRLFVVLLTPQFKQSSVMVTIQGAKEIATQILKYPDKLNPKNPKPFITKEE